MKIIGLTGGIGTGKSTVSNYLKNKGYEIIDADKISREIVLPGSETLSVLANTFGTEVINPDGTLDRKALGQIVFSNDEKRASLDAIMLKKICETIENRVYELKNKTLYNDTILYSKELAFIDAPLLFEAGLDRLADLIITVDASVETRILRVGERDGLSRQEILKRIDSQISRGEQISRSDFVLDNFGSLEELYLQIDKVLKLCLKEER